MNLKPDLCGQVSWFASDLWGAACRDPLELEAQAEAELPRPREGIVSVRREKPAEVRAVGVVVRVREVRRVAQVERLQPGTSAGTVRQLEIAEQAHVEIHHTGAAKNVAARAAQPHVGDAANAEVSNTSPASPIFPNISTSGLI